MIQLSAVIITYNEQRNIGRCLDSLAGIVDEIIVLDSFSTDHTAEICQANSAVKFFQHIFDGHIQQKNRALTLAAHPYVLALDADEALDDTLRQSVLSAKNNWSADGYTMNRLTSYCGQWIRHCGWYPDRKLRLFDRRQGAWGGTNPHDKVILKKETTVTHLPGDLLHYSYYTIQEHRDRARKYALIAAQALHEKGKRSTLGQVILRPVFKFLRNYILKAGFLDGRMGWVICKITAWETYLKYRTLRDLR